MRYLIVIWLGVLSSFVYSQTQLFKSVPKENIFSINVTKVCKYQSSFRFCKEHSELKGTSDFFCNSKKYNCDKLDSLLTIKQYIYEESNLAENCLITIPNKSRL